jgi:hypothetical protein
MIFTISSCKTYAPSIISYNIKLQELYDQLFWSLPQWRGKFPIWKGEYGKKEHVKKIREKIFLHFPEWDNELNKAIIENKVLKGMDEWQVFASLGFPDYPDHSIDYMKFFLDKTISEKGVQKVLRYREMYLEITFLNSQVTLIKLDGVENYLFFIGSE